MFDISLKDLLTELHHKGGVWRTHFCCPRCGYHAPADVFGLWPAPGPLLGSRHVWKDDIIALEKLRIFTAADLLNARPWEILRSSKISHENLAIYVEESRYWLAAEGERARHFLHGQGWPDPALKAISGAMAMRLRR